MAWDDRLQQAAYTSPSGQRLTFDYEDVSVQVEKKTAAFNFPDANGTYVQDNGLAGRQFPLRVIFWGENCDLAAAAFVALLSERGKGKLDHPLYGPATVVPFGAITRNDSLKTAANQVIIEVTFWETIGTAYPTGQLDPAAAVLGAVNAYNTAAAEAAAAGLDTSTALSRADLRGKFTAALEGARQVLRPIARTQAEVERQFDTVYQSITLAIDTLIGDPLTLAFQTSILLQAPARAGAAIADRLTAYRDLARSITGTTPTTANDLYTADAFASTAVSGSVLSAVNNQFTTKTDALAAAVAILAQFDEVAAWRDVGFPAAGEVDTGEPYRQLQSAVALAAGFLVEISFTLKQERRVVLDRPRTIIDLCAELYGEVDSVLDFFIQSNDLTGSEILEMPRGRAVVYYT